MKMLKHILAFLALILVSVPAVQAEEKSWYEIDGIKYRIGISSYPTSFYLNTNDEFIFYDSASLLPTELGRNSLVAGRDLKFLSPITITFPESLMTSWSFRGAVFEFELENTVNDLRPYDNSTCTGARVLDEEFPTYLGRCTTDKYFRRQNSKDRKLLYNNFFNASDKSFADANSNWALSADVTRSSVFIGYYWGVFIPVFNHRFFKVAAGFGAFYAKLSYKLNLCSEFTYGSGNRECIGKREIDSSSNQGFGVSVTGHWTVWERYTKDSIWRYGSVTFTQSLFDNQRYFPLKNHDKNLSILISSVTTDVFTYIYRFR
jgi:hypothetical protein